MSASQDTMSTGTQFCVGLENKPGMLAGLCGALRQAEVNIEAIFVSDDEESCWVNFLADRADAAERTLKERGYNFFSERVLRLVAPDGPGELESIAAKLAAAGININYVYGSCNERASFTLVLHVSDLEKAASLMDG